MVKERSLQRLPGDVLPSSVLSAAIPDDTRAVPCWDGMLVVKE